MKKTLIIIFILLLVLSGCAGPASYNINTGIDSSTLPQTRDSTEEDIPAPDSPSNTPDDSAAPPVLTDPPLHTAGFERPAGDVVEIKEKLFVAQTNDIYLNAGEYLGRTIKYEGIFKAKFWEPTEMTYFYVIRYGPGCCGYDGEAGFEVRWDGDYPEEDDWVAATGVLESYTEGDAEYLCLRLTSLEVLDVRGEEYVTT